METVEGLLGTSHLKYKLYLVYIVYGIFEGNSSYSKLYQKKGYITPRIFNRDYIWLTEGN